MRNYQPLPQVKAMEKQNIRVDLSDKSPEERRRIIAQVQQSADEIIRSRHGTAIVCGRCLKAQLSSKLCAGICTDKFLN